METKEGTTDETNALSEKEINHQREVQFKARHLLVVAFFFLIFIFHALAIYLFCSGFLLSRLVLPNRSECAVPPTDLATIPDTGCWHPQSFPKAVIIVIDALRYDFTIPHANSTSSPHQHFHNALPFLHSTALEHPEKAFLRPFIADPPTTTLQRLKGLTTGTLPTFIDAGSNFAGTAIDEDNLVEQLYLAGKKVVHLGDDTWHSLFPGLFEPNLTRAYDSFNVWDLHTVDEGVNEHLFPLLEPGRQKEWDVVIGHYLGVDHAGHRYGPDHPAMGDKLRQMDGILRRIVEKLDDDTVLVVLGDHGMDVKGDHGGESDDEVEAALWMYSNKGIFGRESQEDVMPPQTAKERPVAQIDLVPTLALLLGIPIPFNNLGHPISEAFHGDGGVTQPDYGKLAEVGRLTAAQIHRYQGEYAKARGLDEDATSSTEALWAKAGEVWKDVGSGKGTQRSAYEAFRAYQAENLRICKSLWARFDIASMIMGIVALVGTFAVIAMYAQGVNGDRAALTPALLGWGLMGTTVGGLIGAGVGSIPEFSFTQYTAFGAAIGGILATLLGFYPAREILKWPVPTTFWGWLCTLSTLLLCIGFASNSFTIWEDEQLLFLLSTFGICMLASSLGQADYNDRFLGATNSLSFLFCTRLASLSRLCREEQMPYCISTYYASSTSSTSAKWQLAIPFAVATLLPSAIKHFYVRTQNYHGSAVIWIGIAMRLGLLLVATFWTIDAADDGDWFPDLYSKSTLKSVRVVIAQIVLALAFAAGYGTYIWASPMLVVRQEAADTPSPTTPSLKSTSKPITSDADAPVLTTISSRGPVAPRPKLIILGYANTHGTRYLLLPFLWLLALLLLSKPMGQGVLALLMISILNLLEVIDANDLRRSPIGPIVLALLGSFHFFKTGHQAALVTIQWESAFVPLKTITYPWSPLLVVGNTFASFTLCTLAVPAVVLWKVPPKFPGLLGRVAGAMATYVLFFAGIALATVVEAGWLRRHLMLYRVFMPRMLVGVVVLLLVEVLGAVAAVGGCRWGMGSVGGIFGWAEG
ncbi:uncharacterized protein MYCGRDRAFT_69132 [Zymoseptoria tritici IPO323]|uniref:Uncharacterized protein n=1 Tax=Zymoseptoria tritici (strain CBS 115943 / IPO323) TaxID=336722 RepID=F9X4W6_ZYMTI|nr:uncharacterized protein MYCGRDRAFT_69132 [Zymoseptoria tritici IPO323]EGP90225.1 hypothetical protein MYCGRDRAFT_69132 [Zymoseptoria tritici IPO323]